MNVLVCPLFDSPRRFFSSLGSMSDSDEERGPASSLRRAVAKRRNSSSLLERASRASRSPVAKRRRRRPRRKEVPRDFLKGKIEKFTGKLSAHPKSVPLMSVSLKFLTSV